MTRNKRKEGDLTMKYRIDTLHNRKHQEVYIISEFLNESGSRTRNLLPGKTFKTKEKAIQIAERIKEGGAL